MCLSQLITDITEDILFKLNVFSWFEAETDFIGRQGITCLEVFKDHCLSAVASCLLVGPLPSPQRGRTWISYFSHLALLFLKLSG